MWCGGLAVRPSCFFKNSEITERAEYGMNTWYRVYRNDPYNKNGF